MPDRIAEIIQEYADNPDEIDIHKVVAEIREIVLGETAEGILLALDILPLDAAELHRCSYCSHVGPDVLQYIGKIGGSDEPRTITNCSDIDACLERGRKC